MTLLGEAKREAPAQTELRPTCAEGFPRQPAIQVALMGFQAWDRPPERRESSLCSVDGIH